MDVYLHQTAVRTNNPGSKMTDIEFLIYTGLRIIICNSQKSIYCISLNQIIGELFGTFSISRRLKTKMKEAFENLMNSLFDVIEELDSNHEYYLVNLSNLIITSNKYVIVDIEDIHKILNLEFTGKIETLFRYYCNIIATVNNYDGIFVGNQSLKIIRDNIDSITNERTQIRYNEILEENHILYIHHNKYFVKEDDKMISTPNFYGKYANKEKIDQMALLNFKATKHPILKSTDTNDIRSLKQKCYAIDRGVKYSEEVLLDLKTQSIKYNQKIDDVILNIQKENDTDKDNIITALNNKKISLERFEPDYFEKVILKKIA